MAMQDPTQHDDEGEDLARLDASHAGEEGLAGTDRPAELELGDADVRLPWLEGDDEEEEYRGGGGQVIMLALLALAALGLIVGGIWWFTRHRADNDLVADGSLIEAPAGPYKTRPSNPGGKEFEGTGDTSFAVSEGEMRPAQLDGQDAAPAPGFETVKPTATPSATPVGKTPQQTATPAPAPVPATGPAVQVGAYSSRALAEAGWQSISSHQTVLKGRNHRIVEGRADIGTVFRLQVIAGDLAGARQLCGQLKAAGQDCSVKN